MNHERLRRIRNWQSDDWYPALVMRPLCILSMLLIADWQSVTPNRLTTMANLCKLAAAWLIVPGWPTQIGIDEAAAPVVAAVLLQLGLLFDHLDGTVARYRRSFTSLGSFYDKVSDLTLWFVICLALGWRAHVLTGDPMYVVLTTCSAEMLAIRGYMKWLVHAETEKLRWREAAGDPERVVAERIAPPADNHPPTRTPGQWLRWLAKMSIQFYRFEEADLFFWVGLGLVLGRIEWLCWLLFLSQIPGLLGMMVRRGFEAYQVDARLRRAGPPI
jgi:phosphatidylglycerophosphate synthase